MGPAPYRRANDAQPPVQTSTLLTYDASIAAANLRLFKTLVLFFIIGSVVACASIAVAWR